MSKAIYSSLAAVAGIAFWAGTAKAQGSIQTLVGTGAAAYSGDGGFASAASVNHPRGLALDANGNLYFADTDNSRVRRVAPNGVISTVVGTGNFGYGGDTGLAVNATVSDVMAVAVDGAGNLYIADASNRRIRKVGSDGKITTIAGTGVEGYSGDGGPATSAMIGRPVALAFDGSGNLYFADSSAQRIRKISTNGTITTVAGNGAQAFAGDGGSATSASLGFPLGVAFDASGNLYIADADHNRVRKVTPGGIITTFAGNGQGGFSGDGGPAANASLNIPSDVAVDSAGNVYIADAGNNRVRKVDPSGKITTIAGMGTNGYNGDGNASTESLLNYPWALAINGTGGVYISDRANNRIRFIPGTLTAPPPPALTDNAVVNGATFARNVAIAPGAIVTIFGTNLASGPATATLTPLPITLGGTSVTFNGEPVPLIYVSPTQINAQAPFDMATGLVKVQVQRGTVTSAVTNSNAALYSPGIFIVNGTTGEGAILHATNNALVSTTAPARGGEYISIYATGLGPVKIPVAAGNVAPSTPPFAETMAQPVVMIGNQQAVVTFSGLAPGFFGLYQINAIVPGSVAAGMQTVQVNMGGYTSNTAMMAVTR